MNAPKITDLLSRCCLDVEVNINYQCCNYSKYNNAK